jgi:phytoene synthase
VVSARPAPRDTDLDRAYRWCAQIARGHYENFPVASLLLPRRMRPAIAAIYAFARRADDFADEPGPTDAARLQLLDDWHDRLVGRIPPSTDGDGLIFLALDDAIRRHGLPRGLFEDLLSAFRQDVSTRRYATWAEVLDYCRRSANPVGRLVLRVAGHDDRVLDDRSDAVCTALQLTNFWQDLGVDWRRGRLYLPLEDCARAGADEADLAAGRWTAAWRSALNEVVERTRELFARGRPVCDGVHGRLRWELRLTWLGGSRVLDEVQALPDVLHHRPRLTLRDLPVLVGRAVAWQASEGNNWRGA